MRTRDRLGKPRIPATAAALLLGVVLVRQPYAADPVVTILATDSIAAEAGPDGGSVTVRRSGGRITCLADLGPLPFQVNWPAPPVITRTVTAATLAEFNTAVAVPGTRIRITAPIAESIRIPSNDIEVLLAPGTSVGGLRVEKNIDRVRVAAEGDDHPRVGHVNLTYGLWPTNNEEEHVDDVVLDGVWMWSEDGSASEMCGRRIAVLNCEADARNYCIWSSTGADYRIQDFIVAGCRFRSAGPEATFRTVDVVRLVFVENDLSNPVKHNYRVHAGDCSLGDDDIFAARNVLRGGGVMHAGMNANPRDHIVNDWFHDNVMYSTTEALFNAGGQYIDFFSLRGNVIFSESQWENYSPFTNNQVPHWDVRDNVATHADSPDPPAPFIAPPPRDGLGAALTVNLTVTGSATPGADYAALPASVTIPAGQASVAVAVTPADDAEPEGAETVTVNLAAGAGYSPGTPLGTPPGATVTIAASDGGSAVALRHTVALRADASRGPAAAYDLRGRCAARTDRLVPGVVIMKAGSTRALTVQ